MTVFHQDGSFVRSVGEQRAGHALPWVIATALCVCATNSSVAQRARFTPDVLGQTTLENGLEVVAIRNPSAPLATAIVAIRGGASIQENEASEGVPHFIEHLLYKSYARTAGHSWESDLALLDRAAWNGFTGEEIVAYYIVVPPKNVSKTIRVLSDLVRNPKFVQEDMDTEKLVVRNELERDYAKDITLLDFTVRQALWGPDWSRKNHSGNIFALNGATPTSLDALYHKAYIPNNAVLVVSGDIVIADVLAAAKQSFASWKIGPPVPAGGVPFQMTPLAASPAAIPVQGTGSDVVIQVDWQGPSAQADSVGATSAALFAALLNNRNSAFQRRLVDEDLFQSVSVGYQLRNHSGPVSLVAQTTPAKLVAATAALQRELATLSDPGTFTDRDLTAAKKYWRVADALQWEQGVFMATAVADHWASAGISSYLGYGDAIGARTVADMRAFEQRYIAGKPRVVGVLISPTSVQSVGATAFNGALKSWSVK